MSWLDADYRGELRVTANLLKCKQNAGVGLLFGRFVSRFFVLDLENFTFGYYTDESCVASGSCVISLGVPLPCDIVGHHRRLRHASLRLHPQGNQHRIHDPNCQTAIPPVRICGSRQVSLPLRLRRRQHHSFPSRLRPMGTSLSGTEQASAEAAAFAETIRVKQEGLSAPANPCKASSRSISAGPGKADYPRQVRWRGKLVCYFSSQKRSVHEAGTLCRHYVPRLFLPRPGRDRTRGADPDPLAFA